jgi:hypothetical protein
MKSNPTSSPASPSPAAPCPSASHYRITGREAIRIARRDHLTLSKHADPVEDAREDLTPDEAEEIAREDEGLLYVDVVPVGWSEGDGSGHEGYAVDAYFPHRRYAGPDEYGIEPTWAMAPTPSASHLPLVPPVGVTGQSLTPEAAYEADRSAMPTYHNGDARPMWKDLGEIAKSSWVNNPTSRNWAPAPVSPSLPAPTTIFLEPVREGGMVSEETRGLIFTGTEKVLKATPAEIVTACNSHATLKADVERLTEIALELVKWERDPDAYGGDLADLAHKAASALSLAEVGKH